MPVAPKKINRIFAWSFSRLVTYRNCPAKAKFGAIDKIYEPANEAMYRGTAVHAMSEAFLTKRVPKIDRAQEKEVMKLWGKQIEAAAKGKLPTELATFKAEYAALKKVPNILVEQQWAFTDKWAQTGWFVMTGEGLAWCRIKVDIHWFDKKTKTIHIRDTKTGKNNKPEEHDEQLSLYALAAFLVYPDAVQADCRMQYVDAGEERTTIHQRADLEKLRKTWEKNAQPILNDRKFPPRPGRLCGWCFYRKDNKENGGGQCQFSGK